MKKALSLDSLLLICKAAHLFDEVICLYFLYFNKRECLLKKIYNNALI